MWVNSTENRLRAPSRARRPAEPTDRSPPRPRCSPPRSGPSARAGSTDRGATSRGPAAARRACRCRGRRSRPTVAPQRDPGDVQADRAELLAEPGVERRGGDRVRVLPERVHVLARGGKEERSGPHLDAALSDGEMSLDVGLRRSRVAALRVAVVGPREEMEMGEEDRRGGPVDARLDLGRGGVGLQRVRGFRRAPNVGEAAHLQGVVPADAGRERQDRHDEAEYHDDAWRDPDRLHGR